ncbi:hypothetical protein [Streptomyces olivochromogenes]|uniref:hypothetical protein n=1 Tax=Streptomyces olivochromogenes TaxID=1963 RepID=UPI001F17B14E|nr:hypothetical protein [Streptomyces olivochromogenes]MCF3132431.1 hypothetical protein [Streptomyces olivochromogenes]
MQLTGVGVVMLLMGVFAPALSSVLRSIAFRIRASGKAELVRAERESGGRAVGERREARRGPHD